jgi:uncharacterized repeat protein (TIGR01451 family)
MTTHGEGKMIFIFSLIQQQGIKMMNVLMHGTMDEFRSALPERRWTIGGCGMPSVLLFLLWMLIGIGGHGQILTSLSPTGSASGQQVTMILTGSGTNFMVATGCYLQSSVQPNYAIIADTWSPNNFTHAIAHFILPPNAPLGQYTLRSQGYLYPPYRNFTMSIGPNSNYGLISGKLIDDGNQNCFQDGNDEGIGSRIVTFMPGPFYASSDQNGAYAIYLPNGIYDVSTSPWGCGPMGCPSNFLRSANISLPNSTAGNNDFYLFATPVACYELRTAVSWGPLRPGFTCLLNVFFEVGGHGAAANMIGEYVLNPAFTYTGATSVPDQISGDTLRWLLNGIGPGYAKIVQISATLPANIPLGTLLPVSSRLYLDPLASSPGLGTAFRYGEVGGSYDPNDKQVFLPDGHTADGPVAGTTSELTYLIRFQNTGTDTAFNINVLDTMDSNLDLGSLHIKTSSDPVEMILGTGNAVQFLFRNIKLVDSLHNEQLSHGFVEYSIRLKANLPVGTILHNRASIYFDFNQPVLTNTTATELCHPLAPLFVAAPTGLFYQFTDQSDTSAQAWQWDFGDGQGSTLQHPTHQFAGTGAYEVCLAVTNSCYTETYCETIYTCQTPNPNFSYQLSGPLVHFTDLSTGIGWHWDFGDGSTSTVHNPTHFYATTGTYNVCLRVIGECLVDSICQVVNLCPATQAAMNYTIAGQTVSFSGTADPSVFAWLWDFGDGYQSYSQNAIHNYVNGGAWNACLIVQNACYVDTVCDTVLLAVGAANAILRADVVIELFPNPTDERLHIAITSPLPQAFEFVIYDAKGIVRSTFTLPSAAVHRAFIDTDSWPAGMYFVRVRGKDGYRCLRVEVR